MNILLHYTKHLGCPVLFRGRELTLDSIHSNYVMCSDGQEKTPILVDECKLIFDSETEFKESEAPADISVIRNDGWFADSPRTPEQIEQDIINEICKCSKSTRDELNSKSRKYAQPRQVHMAIRYLLTHFGESLRTTGEIYNLDHATVLHAIKKVKISTNTKFDIRFREKYRSVWKIVKENFEQNEFNLDWL